MKKIVSAWINFELHLLKLIIRKCKNKNHRIKSSEKGLIINKKNTFMALKVHFNLTNTENGKCYILLFFVLFYGQYGQYFRNKKVVLFIDNKYNKRSQIFNELKLYVSVYTCLQWQARCFYFFLFYAYIVRYEQNHIPLCLNLICL